jgi:hypothetical protein
MLDTRPRPAYISTPHRCMGSIGGRGLFDIVVWYGRDAWAARSGPGMGWVWVSFM